METRGKKMVEEATYGTKDDMKKQTNKQNNILHNL